MSQTGQPALTTHPTTATPPHPTSPTCPLSSSSTAPPSEIPESAVVTSPPVSPHSQRMASEKSSSPANPDVGQSADPVNQDKVSGSGQGVGGTPTTPRAPRSALYPSLLPVRSREPGETASRNLTVTNATAPPPLTVSGPPQRSPSLSSALSHEGQSAPWSSLWLHNPKPFSATPSIKTDDVSIITSLTSKHLHIDGYGPDSEEPMVETVLKHARRTLPGETASVVSAEPAVAAGKTADKEELLDQGSADINEAIQMRRVRSRMLLHWRPNFKELRDLLGLEYRFIKPKSLMALDRRILKQGWYELIPWYPERSPASCHESHLDFLSERPDCLTGPSSPRPSAVQPEEQLADDGDDGSCDSVIAHSDEESEVAPLKPTSLGATTAAYAPKLIQPVTPSAQVAVDNPSFIPCEEAFVLPLHGVDLEPFFAGIRVYHNGNPVVAFNTDIAPEWLDAFITAKSAHQIRDESRRSRENKAMKQWKFPDYNKPSDQDKRFWRYWRSSSVSKQPRSQPTPNKKPASYTVAAGRSSSGEISAPMAPNSSASGRPQSSGPTSPKHTNVLSVLHSSAESHSHQRKTSIGSFRALWTGGSSTGTTSIQPKAVTVTQTTSSTAAQSLTSTLSSLGTQPPPFFGKLGSNQEGAATEFGTQLSRPGSPATLGDTLGGVVSCEWVPDDAVTVCMVCRNTVFTLLVRKHHCRHCGRVICYRCSVMAASRGDKLVRLCTECSQRYQVVSPAVSPTLHRIRRDTTPVNDRHGGGSPLDAHNSPPCTLVHMGTGSPLSPLFHRRHVSPTKPHSHAPQPMAIPQSPRHLAGRRRRPVSLAVGPQCSRQRTVSLGRASGYRHPLSLDDRPCSPRPLSASVTGNTYDPYHPNPEATSPTHTTMSIPDLPSKNPLHPNPSCPVMTTDSIGQPTSDLPMSCSFDAILNPFREHRPSSPSLGRSHEVNGRARANSLLCGLSPPSAFPRGRVLAGMNYPSHESLAQALAPTSVTHAGTHASTGPSSATLTPSSSFANVPHHMVSSQSTHTHTPSHYPPSISILHTGATMPFKSQTCHPPPPGPYGNPALWYIPPWATTPVFGSIESTLTTVSDIPSLGTSHRMALVNQGIDPPAGSSTHPRRRAQPMQSITTFSFRKPDTLDPPVLTHRVQNNESPPPNDKPSLAPRVPTNPADSCHDTSHPAT
ncbi:hypothetical protein IWQ62_001935 [Dispira parvispora]|uniref:FYVE-type domain-containing protein n=1 Tax=Dispira parvispora TaxID=1520584 RepID=A0A9W8AWS5_9FUNG|nr:hypothetical protein IWQ62_001935 [Dispira parvispora]